MPVVSLHTKMRLSSHAQTGKRQMTVRFTGHSRTVESLLHSSGAMCLEVAPGFLENSRTSAVVFQSAMKLTGTFRHFQTQYCFTSTCPIRFPVVVRRKRVGGVYHVRVRLDT